MNDVYSDIPLKTSTHTNIRLLRLYNPHKDQAQRYGVACKLEVFPASTHIPYTAVSYMWGSATETADIIINGNRFPVTLNLLSLLEELTAQSHDGWLWIDATCIDQTSISERNHQVALMDRIYSRADYVFVWLGPPTDNMIKAYSFLMNPKLSDYRFKRQDTKGFVEICEHPYWKRAWIVQEFILALSVQICFGQYRVPLLRFDRIVNRVKNVNLSVKKSRALELLTMRADWQQPSRVYYDPIYADDMLDCADPRDRVFAMVSLMNPQKKLKADYSLTALQLFDRVAGGQYLDCKTIERISIRLGLDLANRWRCTQPAWRRGTISLGSDFQSSQTCHNPNKDPVVSAGPRALKMVKEHVHDSYETDTKTPSYLFYESEDTNEPEDTDELVLGTIPSVENHEMQLIPVAYEANKSGIYTYEDFLESSWKFRSL